jgi:hypothetical protein
LHFNYWWQRQLDFNRIPLSRRAFPTQRASDWTARKQQRTVIIASQKNFSYELFMNVLFELYGKSSRIEVKQFGASDGEYRRKGRAPVTTALVLLCLAGIAFNVRFALAPQRERTPSTETQPQKRMSLNANNHSTQPYEDALKIQGSLGWLDNHSHTQSH